MTIENNGSIGFQDRAELMLGQACLTAGFLTRQRRACSAPKVRPGPFGFLLLKEVIVAIVIRMQERLLRTQTNPLEHSTPMLLMQLVDRNYQQALCPT